MRIMARTTLSKGESSQDFLKIDSIILGVESHTHKLSIKGTGL